MTTADVDEAPYRFPVGHGLAVEKYYAVRVDGEVQQRDPLALYGRAMFEVVDGHRDSNCRACETGPREWSGGWHHNPALIVDEDVWVRTGGVCGKPQDGDR